MTELTAVEPQKELKTQTWRVLQLDPNAVPAVTRWLELAPLTGEGEYGFRPSAGVLGEAYGEGDYIIIEERANYYSCDAISVVAEKFFRERTDEDD